MTDARTLTHALRGRWYGRYGVAFCPAHGNTRTPALSLSDGRNGSLLAKCFAGCNFFQIAEALRGLGITDTGRMAEPDPAELARRREADRQQAVRRQRQAVQVWTEAEPIAGTLAETYLRKRAITGPLPDCLRFHPACWHGPTARRHPALVASVVRRGEILGVQRIYLDGTGRKAAIDPVKLSLGQCAGGAVRLLDGSGALVACEGIETGLSLLDGLRGRCGAVWACLGTKGLEAVELPLGLTKLVIGRDGDAPGNEAANALAARAISRRIETRIMAPPDGCDWNDVARGAAA